MIPGYPLSLITYAYAAGNKIAQMEGKDLELQSNAKWTVFFPVATEAACMHALSAKSHQASLGKENPIQSTAWMMEFNGLARKMVPKAREIQQTAMVFERGCFLTTERITPVISPSISNSLDTTGFFMHTYNII